MFIGNIDKIETSKIIKRAQRKRSIAERNVSLCQSTSRQYDPMSEDSSCSTELNGKMSKDEDYASSKFSVRRINSSKKTCDESVSKSFQSAKQLKLLSFSEACDRVRVSNRGAVLVSFSLMKDIIFYDADSDSIIMDKIKIQRERNSTRIAKQRE